MSQKFDLGICLPQDLRESGHGLHGLAQNFQVFQSVKSQRYPRVGTLRVSLYVASGCPFTVSPAVRGSDIPRDQERFQQFVSHSVPCQTYRL